MLTLNDGRSELWQWDTGRKLTVDADCSQVHFSNKVFGRSIDVDVVDGVAIIPDILLQTDKELTAWAFVGTAENGYTKISKVFKVNKRNKPADYVFTPADQTTLEEIKEKLDYLESIQDPDAIKDAVEDYLEQNPVEAPVQSVNGQKGDVRLTAEDVGAISEDDLQKATNEALAQAKASGEFDGPAGPAGAPGVSGVYVGSGEMPEGYNVQIDPDGDPFDGIISPEAVEKAVEEYLEANPPSQGAPGKDGADGYTPVKGVDYFTPEEVQEIAEQAAELVEVPSGGGIDVTGAEVGQIIKVAEVDENGRPTVWEPIDLKMGWKLVTDFTLEEDVQSAAVPLSKPVTGEILLQIKTVAAAGNTEHADLRFYFNNDSRNELLYFERGIYVGTDVESYFKREYEGGWFTPVFDGRRFYDIVIKNMDHGNPSANTIIHTVNLHSSSTSNLLGIGTRCKVYSR